MNENQRETRIKISTPISVSSGANIAATATVGYGYDLRPKKIEKIPALSDKIGLVLQN